MKLLCTFVCILVHILMLLQCSSTKRAANSRRKKQNILKQRNDWLFPYWNNITQQTNTMNDLCETLFLHIHQKVKKEKSLVEFGMVRCSMVSTMCGRYFSSRQRTIDADLLGSLLGTQTLYTQRAYVCVCVCVRTLFYGCRRRNIAEFSNANRFSLIVIDPTFSLLLANWFEFFFFFFKNSIIDNGFSLFLF